MKRKRRDKLTRLRRLAELQEKLHQFGVPTSRMGRSTSIPWREPDRIGQRQQKRVAARRSAYSA